MLSSHKKYTFSLDMKWWLMWKWINMKIYNFMWVCTCLYSYFIFICSWPNKNKQSRFFKIHLKIVLNKSWMVLNCCYLIMFVVMLDLTSYLNDLWNDLEAKKPLNLGTIYDLWNGHFFSNLSNMQCTCHGICRCSM